ncbi:MAG: rhombosortase [Opitutaceae bacterium]
MSRPARPWVALIFSLAALFAWFWPRSREFLLYDRGLIGSGQWWRLWSGHLAHHSASHLGWNLAVFFPAAVWLERIRPAVARFFFAASPLFISASLWYLDPHLQFYAGLSGVTMGGLTLLTLAQLRRTSSEPRWIWLVVLVLLAAKIAAEFMRPQTALFAGLPEGIRNVPLAHLAGAAFGVVVVGATQRRKPS